MVISKEEETAHYNQVLKGGFIGGSAGLGLGLAGLAVAARRSAAVRQLTLPFRAFLVSSAGTFAAITTADHYSRAFHRAQDPRSLYRSDAARARDATAAPRRAPARAAAWAREHRYGVVFASWAAAMAAALALVGRNRALGAAQRLVQARVYAQGLTLAVLLATAALETSDATAGAGRWETVLVLDPEDPKHEHLVEKRVHKEEYEGQDLWKGEWFPSAPYMVAAEERRLQPKLPAEKAKQGKEEQTAQEATPASN